MKGQYVTRPQGLCSPLHHPATGLVSALQSIWSKRRAYLGCFDVQIHVPLFLPRSDWCFCWGAQVRDTDKNTAHKGRCTVQAQGTAFEEAFTSEYVLCTVPLGVLQNNTINFEPPLSEEKQASINALGMGVENKVVLRFRKVFWPEKRYLQCTGEPYKRLAPHAATMCCATCE